MTLNNTPLNVNDSLNQPNRKFEKFLEINDGESTKSQHLWDIARTSVGENFVIMNVYNTSIWGREKKKYLRLLKKITYSWASSTIYMRVRNSKDQDRCH